MTSTRARSKSSAGRGAFRAKASLDSGSASGRATIRELHVIKRVDKASTALMGAVRTNEVIKEAVLTLRKSGKGALEFLKITIEQGRLMSIEIDAGDAQGGSLAPAPSA